MAGRLLHAAVALALVHTVDAAAEHSSEAKKTPAHIIHIVIDDLGFHDTGYKDSEVLSPHIDALRASGVHLTNFYAAKWCAPSRSSMMTGRYPWRNGYYSTPSSSAVPLSTTMLSEVLQKNAYRTHAIGKWHLGYRLKEYTPTYRGFDTFLGFYNSMEDYFTHYGPKPPGAGPCSGVDMSNSSGATIRAASSALNGTYSSEIYAARFEEVVADHVGRLGADVPLYVYLPFQSVHMPNEAPADEIAKHPPMKNNDRRMYLGMISAVDTAIGRVVAALKSAGLWNNSVVLLNGDNGGPVWCSSNGNCTQPQDSEMYGPVSNFPLRSGKWTSWDGGFRVNALLSGGLVPAARRNASWGGTMHVSDVLPTFAGLAGVPVPATAVDGVAGMWEAIISMSPSPRREVAHMITNEWAIQNSTGHPCNSCSSNKTLPSPHTVPEPGVNCAVTQQPFANETQWGNNFVGCGGALLIGDLKLLVGYPGDTRLFGPPEAVAGSGHEGAPDLNRLGTFPCQDHCLFNTSADPSETTDLSADPAFAGALQAMLARYSVLSAEGENAFTYGDMLKETGEVCKGGVNDSCAVANRSGVVEPCGYGF
jgi:arylsulfatase A-like enzyme